MIFSLYKNNPIVFYLVLTVKSNLKFCVNKSKAHQHIPSMLNPCRLRFCDCFRKEVPYCPEKGPMFQTNLQNRPITPFLRHNKKCCTKVMRLLNLVCYIKYNKLPFRSSFRSLTTSGKSPSLISDNFEPSTILNSKMNIKRIICIPIWSKNSS